MSKPWECPRCGRMNAPFNAMCFCKPSSQEQLDFEEMRKGAKGEAPFIPMPLPAQLPYGLKRSGKCTVEKCLICSGYHGNGVQCAYMVAE